MIRRSVSVAKKLTLKQRRLLEAIPTSKTLMEAGNKAGYTSHQIYRQGTQKHIEQIIPFTPEDIKREYARCYKEAKKYSDKLHSLDSQARILGLNLDRQEIKQEVSQKGQAILDRYMRIPMLKSELQQDKASDCT